MYRIVDARDVGFKIRLFTIEAPRIARKQRPGQFVILRVREGSERIPLTIKAADTAAWTITICVQSVGKTTSLLNCRETGDAIRSQGQSSQRRSNFSSEARAIAPASTEL